MVISLARYSTVTGVSVTFGFSRESRMPRRPPAPADTRRRAYAAWLVVCLIWGTTYLAIRIAIESIPPLVMAGARWVIAAVVLLAVLRARGVRVLPLAAWPSLAVLGILLLGFGNGAVVWAEQTIPSGLTAVLVSIVPFWMVGLETLVPGGDRLTARRGAGLLVGFAGVLLLVWPELGGGASRRLPLGGLITTQLACAGWAAGSSYARRRSRQEPAGGHRLAASALQMLFGGLVLLMAGLLIGERPGLSITARSAGAVLYLIVFGSIGAYSAYMYALHHLPVATVSLYVYVNTLIAVVLGTLVLDEPFSWRIGAAAAIVLAGVALVRNEG